jgi:cobalamin-dependent methionine synthase I
VLIIAEKINSTRKSIAEAIEAKDATLIQKEALAQAEVGADYIDVNAGTFIKEEADHVKWLIQIEAFRKGRFE